MLAKFGIDLGVEVFDVDVRDRRPGFLHVGEGAAQQHVHHAHLGGREFAALDLGVAADAAEEVVDDGEHQLRIQHEQRRAAQRVDLDEIEVDGQRQRVGVLAELLHRHLPHRQLDGLAQQVVQA